LKLPVRKKPYSVRISPSLRLGYRRNQTAGVWSMIVADGKGGSWMKRFAIADDFEESDGRSVLDFWQAQKQARLLARGGHDGESDYGKPATVAEALDAYEKDLAARGGILPETFAQGAPAFDPHEASGFADGKGTLGIAR
jgi:hypothetical protein